ncbi:aminoacyl-histidine dipeptidase [Pseudoalteromonas luteoviolacea CPMOR-2]|uniref:Cytosol non-specific dipeptidase n=1 Tax=Pseudoalteromonas luteoviolacea DSM 6061 TaxID=1365250 RepID=A0A166WYL3_9GAMM|nr:aminoacyl-histidine dipeptidase [Pseudoalteromonas luteoviolacea]KZN39043.1 aminoacyl-histidine dipeptidase [Pseudoalteromonas luteoviolacea DSM 6061]KZN56905.1 aminoacyl-histidine dipeptidase [Pseudoalteromonas luteoviolacea CPMOR-2]MBE0389935.1 dipeptidase D [Pseudoalteromonas luteoviolacea DSM 6061]
MFKPHSEISNLEPKAVWQFFDQICSIPHPSKHEEALAQFIVDWASSQNLAVRRDKTGNVFIKKPATTGMENRKPVVLQAHIDMVPQKNNDTSHDFVTDPIKPYVDGEWVTADGTTLGADNGIGMASCLAVLASDDIAHGPLEVILTVDEEAGMTGAFGLEAGWLEGDILLNTDSEQEGEIYMGCAGGIDASLNLNIQRQSKQNNQVYLQISLKGLKGGHSGVDIHTGRANANKLLARALKHHLPEIEFQVVEFNGGSLRNAIPREANVTIAVNDADVNTVTSHIQSVEKLMQQELAAIETGLVFNTTQVESTLMPLSRTCTAKLLSILNACPNGVVRMSDDIKGVVETSLNLGVISTENDSIEILCLIRSLIDSGRKDVEGTLTSLAELAGAQIEFSGAYPGWKPDPDSELIHIFRDMYEGIYGNKPDIMVIHAGLECGLFKEPYPDMDMISFGPTIKFPHSPDEKVHIESVGLYWQQMQALLSNIPVKS